MGAVAGRYFTTSLFQEDSGHPESGSRFSVAY